MPWVCETWKKAPLMNESRVERPFRAPQLYVASAMIHRMPRYVFEGDKQRLWRKKPAGRGRSRSRMCLQIAFREMAFEGLKCVAI